MEPPYGARTRHHGEGALANAGPECTACDSCSSRPSLLFVIGVGTALLLDHMQQTAREAADGLVQRAASVVESTINRLFLQIDGTLASLPGLVGQLSRDQGFDADEVSRMSAQHQLPEPELPRPAAGPAGRRRLGQRATFLEGPSLPIDPAELGLAPRSGAVSIVGPVQNPTTGEWALFFTRPVKLPGAGTLYAAAEVPVPLIATLLKPAAEVPGLRVAVTRAGGRLLVSLPHDEERISSQAMAE